MDLDDLATRRDPELVSAGASRALLALLCALCVLAVSSLARAADGTQPTRSRVTFAVAPSTLNVQIGALSEHLFDAATASRWPAARVLVQGLHDKAELLDSSYEGRFVDAGGDLEDLHFARQQLARRLTQSDDALASGDQPALEEAANQITLIAGELAQPFAEERDSPPELKIMAAMFQARRMLESLAWGDQPGYESAHRQFEALWLALRDSSGIDSARLATLDRALTVAALSGSRDTDRQLQAAAQDAEGVRTAAGAFQ